MTALRTMTELVPRNSIIKSANIENRTMVNACLCCNIPVLQRVINQPTESILAVHLVDNKMQKQHIKARFGGTENFRQTEIKEIFI